MKRKFQIICAAAVSVFASSLAADDSKSQAQKSLEALVGPSMAVSAFEETAVENVYEAVIEGQIYHIYAVDHYVMIGEVFNTQSQTSLKDDRIAKQLDSVVQNEPLAQMIVFAGSETKRHITVFTDIDCGYCRRLHREVPELNQAGVEVRYMAYPRAGVGSASYDKIVDVWCSVDQQTAMTEAKNGVKVEAEACENPVESQYLAAAAAGVQGTPTIIVDDGSLIGGYVPAEELLAMLGLTKN